MRCSKLTARLGVPLIPSFSRRGRRGFFACSGSMPKQIAKLAPLTKSLIVPNPSRLNEGLRDSVMIQGLRTIFALLWRESASVRGNRWSIGKRAKTSQKAPPDVRSRGQRLPLRKWHAQRFSWIYLPHPILLPPGEKRLFVSDGSTPKHVAKLAPLANSLIMPNHSRLNEGFRGSVISHQLRTTSSLPWRERARVRGKSLVHREAYDAKPKNARPVRMMTNTLKRCLCGSRTPRQQRLSRTCAPSSRPSPARGEGAFLQERAIHLDTLSS